ncbi:MAG: potassium-transporting ATPase subunit KdpA [Oscillospiraceae bacterium]
MSNAVLQYGLYLIILIALAVPLGLYIGRVMNGEKVFLSKILVPAENLTYKALRINKDEQMGWKKYALSTLLFSLIGFVFLFLLCLLQGVLPLNPENRSGTSWHLAFNIAASFVTNTNWQSYSGETTLSNLTQMLGLTVQNFVSAAVGIAVLFVLIRGFTKVNEKGIGSFWVDMTRITLYILLPLSLIIALLLVSQGVVQSFSGNQTVELLQPVTLQDGTVITSQVIPSGPAASQIAIKQLGTNGGGFFGMNSAFPLENPTVFSNLLELLSILLIPVALCFTFGRNVKDKRQGITVFAAMFILLTASLGIIAVNEQTASSGLSQSETVDTAASSEQAGGNMEGKETRFGIASSATWAAFTTAASNGSVNSALDSNNPLSGLAEMLSIQLGEVIFGGVGCGLYGMLAFVILTVFIAGLMVGRTPEYLGKKIEPFEMKMAVVICLAAPVAILTGSMIAAMIPGMSENLTNGGAHGFSELLYAFSSAGGNNGSAFAGLSANIPFLNTALGVIMLLTRFVPMIAALAIAGSLCAKKKLAVTAGTLPTHNALFVGMLIVVVLLVGALSFFPALALGPIAEFLQK